MRISIDWIPDRSEGMRLFDDIERSHVGYASRRTPWFVCINRSARAPMAGARDLLESWFDQYPQSSKADLRGRFRSRENQHAWGAYLELLLHEVFRKAGFDLDIHLAGACAPGRADLTLKRGGSSVLRVEARAITTTWTDVFEGPRIAELLDRMDQLEMGPFFLCIDLEGPLDGNVPHGRWAKQVEAWIQQLSKAQDEESVGVPIGERTWTHGGFQMRLRVKHGQGRPLVHYGCRMGRFVERIRKGLGSKKARRYGESEVPFAIALGLFEGSLDDGDVFDAVFGDMGTVFGEDDRIEDIRRANGFWHGPGGPQNTSVSGVIYLRKPGVFSLKGTQMTLLKNPWAKSDIKASAWPFRMIVPDEETGKLEILEGRNPSEFLGLPEVWPLPENHELDPD